MLQKALFQQKLESFQVHEKLAFIVVGATGVDGFLSGGGVRGDHGLEGVRAPFFQRLRRLYVVMSIDQDGLRGALVVPAEHHGVPGGLVHGRLLRAGFLEQFHQAACAAVHILLVLRLGTHRGNAQEREQFLEKPFFILFDITFHRNWVLCKDTHFRDKKKPRTRISQLAAGIAV